MNVNADALSRNRVEQAENLKEVPINIVTRSQLKINEAKPSKNTEQMENNGDEKITKDTARVVLEKLPKVVKRRGRSKKVIQKGAMEKKELDKNLVREKMAGANEGCSEDERINQQGIINPIDKIQEEEEEVHCPNRIHEEIDEERIDSSEEDSTNSQSESEDEQQPRRIEFPKNQGKIIETKNLFQYQKDKLVYFLTEKGTPGNEGARILETNNKLWIPKDFKVGESQCIKKGIRYYFPTVICKEEGESKLKIKENLRLALKQLHEIADDKAVERLTISQSKEICGIVWDEIKEMLKVEFKDGKIKILICKNEIKYVPPEERDSIFHENHSSPIGGHKGVSKTYHRIKNMFYWENLKEDIQRRIQQCLNCQLKKLVRVKTKKPMIITDTPGRAFTKVALDIVGPLPITSTGNVNILTMQDLLTKYCIAVPLKDALATTVAEAFINHFICKYGSPRIVLTDEGRNFISGLMNRVAKRFRIKKLQATAFRPQSNCSLERSHHVSGEYLKQYTDREQECDRWINMAMLSYNTSVHEGTNYTPHELVYGDIARMPSSEPLSAADELPTYQGFLTQIVTQIVNNQKLAYNNLIKAKEKSKVYYDRKITPIDYKVGDSIYLTSGPKPHKLGNQHSGPFEILEIVENGGVKIVEKRKFEVVHPNRIRISQITPDEAKKLQTKDVRKKRTEQDPDFEPNF